MKKLEIFEKLNKVEKETAKKFTLINNEFIVEDENSKRYIFEKIYGIEEFIEVSLDAQETYKDFDFKKVQKRGKSGYFIEKGVTNYFIDENMDIYYAEKITKEVPETFNNNRGLVEFFKVRKKICTKNNDISNITFFLKSFKLPLLDLGIPIINIKRLAKSRKGKLGTSVTFESEYLSKKIILTFLQNADLVEIEDNNFDQLLIAFKYGLTDKFFAKEYYSKYYNEINEFLGKSNTNEVEVYEEFKKSLFTKDKKIVLFYERITLEKELEKNKERTKFFHDKLLELEDENKKEELVAFENKLKERNKINEEFSLDIKKELEESQKLFSELMNLKGN